jgi:hypothetical protein
MHERVSDSDPTVPDPVYVRRLSLVPVLGPGTTCRSAGVLAGPLTIVKLERPHLSTVEGSFFVVLSGHRRCSYGMTGT